MEDLKHVKKTLTRGMLVVQKVSWDDAGWDLFVLFFRQLVEYQQLNLED